MRATSPAIWLSALALCALAGSCAARNGAAAHETAERQPTSRRALSLPTLADQRPRDYPGIHNAVAYSEGFISGGAPEGDAGFDTLAAMGVRTIISVDGAAPEVERARVRGLRYIHLPVGYNGFDQERKLQLARATRDGLRNGLVYIHCHHGRHRSAGAAAVVSASLGSLSPEQGVARMRVSGTAPAYTGLYACAAQATALAPDIIERVPADFPETWTPTGLVRGMIALDEVFENLKDIEKSGWTAPADHPDLVPAAEAARLADLFRVLSEGDCAAGKTPEFVQMMRSDQALALRLETAIVGGADAALLGATLERIAAACTDCHAKYRD